MLEYKTGYGLVWPDKSRWQPLLDLEILIKIVPFKPVRGISCKVNPSFFRLCSASKQEKTFPSEVCETFSNLYDVSVSPAVRASICLCELCILCALLHILLCRDVMILHYLLYRCICLQGQGKRKDNTRFKEQDLITDRVRCVTTGPSPV